MKKNILAALDDSLHSKHAVQYLLRISSLIKDFSCTLLMVQPDVSGFMVDEAKKDINARLALEKIRQRNAESATDCLTRHKTSMCEKGLAENCIEIQTLPKKIGLAKDILVHAEEKRFDAIAVGRRGISRMQELFSGSVTGSLIEHSRVIPLWVIDGDVTNTDIMLAADGSESGMRAVDHISYIFAGSPDVKITLVHVLPSIKEYCPIDFETEDKEIEDLILRGDKKCVEDFLVHAYKKFKDAGITKDQIRIKELPKARNIGKALVQEAEEGGYGTVVFGRRGIGKSFFMGSVSNYLVNKLSGRAMWLVS